VRYFIITPTREIELPLGTVYIGRSPDCLIRLDENAASRIHIRLHCTNEGVTATDLGSLNGTFLNGTRIHEDRRLRAGDVLRIAETTLILKQREAVDPSNRPASAPPLRATVEVIYCPRCGGPLVAGSELCGHCEHALPVVRVSTQAQSCPHCRATQPKAARFCGNCGRELRVVKI
jgi:hypothetical protein